MDETILQKIMVVSEKFFGTVTDPEQIPITRESYNKLQLLHPKTIAWRVFNNEPMSWVVVVPTQLPLMHKFLQGEINERELLKLSEPQDVYSALYLCAAFTVPEYRRKGYITEMYKQIIAEIPLAEDVALFAWPTSPEGKAVVEKMNQKRENKILIKIC